MGGLVTDNRQDDGFVVDGPNRLPSHVQVQIRRLYLQGRSYREIQRIVGCSPVTVSRYLAPVTRGRFVQ